MRNTYFSGSKGPYTYCDICGQPCYMWEITKLSPETGRGGLLVCRDDADRIDPGLMPITPPKERIVPFSRPDNSSTNGSEPYDVETQGIF